MRCLRCRVFRWFQSTTRMLSTATSRKAEMTSSGISDSREKVRPNFTLASEGGFMPHRFVRAAAFAGVGFIAMMFVGTTGEAQKRSIDFLKEPACQTLTPTSQGGPAPRDPNLMVL